MIEMRLGVLFSGGKDSVFACFRAMEKNEVVSLIAIVSENEDSYMFHTPNIRRVDFLAEAIGIPLLTWPTKGEEEKELEDLKDAISAAKETYGIEGIVTGAIESVYQAARVQRICRDLALWCFNPIWQIDQVSYLKLLISEGFEVIITGVFAYPLDESWVGAKIDERRVKELEKLQNRYHINPAGEGGELETFVLDGPIFKKRIQIIRATKTYGNYRGHFRIEDMRLMEKQEARK